jgi:hypothetical protein
MSLRQHPLPAGFIEPCLPTSIERPPSGTGWLHEIKRKNDKRVMLYGLVVATLANPRTRLYG